MTKLRRMILPFLIDSHVFQAWPIISAHIAAPPRILAAPELVLDPALTPDVVDGDWTSGQAHVKAHAVLELNDCEGQLLDRLTLEAPLRKHMRRRDGWKQCRASIAME